MFFALPVLYFFLHFRAYERRMRDNLSRALSSPESVSDARLRGPDGDGYMHVYVRFDRDARESRVADHFDAAKAVRQMRERGITVREEVD